MKVNISYQFIRGSCSVFIHINVSLQINRNIQNLQSIEIQVSSTYAVNKKIILQKILVTSKSNQNYETAIFDNSFDSLEKCSKFIYFYVYYFLLQIRKFKIMAVYIFHKLGDSEPRKRLSLTTRIEFTLSLDYE